MAQWVKNPSTMQKTQKTWVRFLGQEDSLEEGMVTHSSILAWIISWREEPGGLQSKGSQRVIHDWVIKHACPQWTWVQIVNQQWGFSCQNKGQVLQDSRVLLNWYHISAHVWLSLSKTQLDIKVEEKEKGKEQEKKEKKKERHQTSCLRLHKRENSPYTDEQVHGSQSVVPGTEKSASSENLLRMEILGLIIDQQNEEVWSLGTVICLLTSSPGDGLKGKNWRNGFF